MTIYPGQYFDCAVVSKSDIVVEGVGNTKQVVMIDKACERSFAYISGRECHYRTMTVTHVRVPDENGAAIRGKVMSI